MASYSLPIFYSPSDKRNKEQSQMGPLPEIHEGQSFVDRVRALSVCIADIIDVPHSFDQLRTATVGHILRPLTTFLSENCHHPNIIAALLVLSWHYSDLEPDDRGVNITRAAACEIIAWRILNHLSEDDLIEYLLYELPSPQASLPGPQRGRENERVQNNSDYADEATNLLTTNYRPHPQFILNDQILPPLTPSPSTDLYDDYEQKDPTLPFVGLTALDIAIIANAKRFLSQRLVQKVINDIWCGNIVFWDSLDLYAPKKPMRYNRGKTDPYCRLRVPRYQKVFETLFFLSLLALYYANLYQGSTTVTVAEIFFYVWLISFSYEEWAKLDHAGKMFYTADFWSVVDLGIIGIGALFFLIRMAGFAIEHGNGQSIRHDTAFDVLSLQALFLLPRICSLLSLNPFFGSLIPCLKSMAKIFVKYLGFVILIYLGFLTTFTLLARDKMSFSKVSWMLIRVFFGASYIGFDLASEISPWLGPPLMLVFVGMTNILLVTSLISLLSSSLSKVMANSREEYLFQYSAFVLEASALRGATYYLPPFNLIRLFLGKPCALLFGAEHLRAVRIILLKLTHLPYVAAIWMYETSSPTLNREHDSWVTKSRAHARRKDVFASHVNPWGKKRYHSVAGNELPVSTPQTPLDESQIDHLSEVKRMLGQLGGQVKGLVEEGKKRDAEREAERSQRHDVFVPEGLA